MTEERAFISVVIPTYNEAGEIGACLGQFAGLGGVEVVVADGGSEDGTGELVRTSDVGRLVTCGRRGRAHQMNEGAGAATGTVLLFLHADCRLPDSWVEDVTGALGDPAAVGGRFRLGIDADSAAFRLIAFFSTLRSRFLGITYGDQAIFVRKPVFETVGGFPDRMIFEDSEFCEAVEAQGRFVMTDSAVVSSARRWRAWGVWRTVFRMWYLRLLYALSVPDERLAERYRNVR